MFRLLGETLFKLVYFVETFVILFSYFSMRIIIITPNQIVIWSFKPGLLVVKVDTKYHFSASYVAFFQKKYQKGNIC